MVFSDGNPSRAVFSRCLTGRTSVYEKKPTSPLTLSNGGDLYAFMFRQKLTKSAVTLPDVFSFDSVSLFDQIVSGLVCTKKTFSGKGRSLSITHSISWGTP